MYSVNQSTMKKRMIPRCLELERVWSIANVYKIRYEI